MKAEVGQLLPKLTTDDGARKRDESLAESETADKAKVEAEQEVDILLVEIFEDEEETKEHSGAHDGNHMASDEVTLSKTSSSSEFESESESESSESSLLPRFFFAALRISRVVLGVLREEKEPK